MKLIDDIAAVSYKLERIAAAIILIATLFIPQYFLHGFDHIDNAVMFIIILGLVGNSLFLGSDLANTGDTKQLYIAACVTGLAMLPISFAQKYTVGFHILATVMYVPSTLIVESWVNIQINSKKLFELNQKPNPYKYRDFLSHVGYIVMIGVITSLISGMDPIVVSLFSAGILIYVAYEMTEIDNSLKSYMYSVRSRVEREAREAQQKAWEEILKINDEE